MTLAEESEAYQAQLETARTHPDNTEVQDDLIKARAALEVAWLRTVQVGEGR
jgi:hypothetical protein